jgi:hypothetical protein
MRAFVRFCCDNREQLDAYERTLHSRKLGGDSAPDAPPATALTPAVDSDPAPVAVDMGAADDEGSAWLRSKVDPRPLTRAASRQDPDAGLRALARYVLAPPQPRMPSVCWEGPGAFGADEPTKRPGSSSEPAKRPGAEATKRPGAFGADTLRHALLEPEAYDDVM